MFFQRKLKRGFTLVELLVVIAIFGILASIVLLALNNTRKRAMDARVKSSVAQLRNIFEDYNDTSGNYLSLVCNPSNWNPDPVTYPGSVPSKCEDWGSVAVFDPTKPTDDVQTKRRIGLLAKDIANQSVAVGYNSGGLSLNSNASNAVIIAPLPSTYTDAGGAAQTKFFCKDVKGSVKEYTGWAGAGNAGDAYSAMVCQ